MSDTSPIAATVSDSPMAIDKPALPSTAIPEGVPVDAAGVPVGEACPPPLQWQEVLAAFSADSQPWELDVGPRRLIGRTWGSGPPLYLLNGFAASAQLYSLMAYLLRDTFRCVVFDTVTTPAGGRSPASIDDFARDLLAAADLHGDTSFSTYAAASGSAAALNAAVLQPQRITALALQHGFTSRRLSWSERLLAAWYRNSSKPLAAIPWRRRIQELNHRRWFPPFDSGRFEYLVEATGQIPVAELARKALAIHKMDLGGKLADVRCPVLLIRTEGQGVQEDAGIEALQKELPHSVTESMHSTGLHPCLTHPHRVAKLLKSFLLPILEGPLAGTGHAH